jgi:hypothetical protein
LLGVKAHKSKEGITAGNTELQEPEARSLSRLYKLCTKIKARREIPDFLSLMVVDRIESLRSILFGHATGREYVYKERHDG